LRLLLAPSAFAILFGVVVALQLALHDTAMAPPIWAAAEKALELDLVARISVAPHLALPSLGMPLLFILAFCASFFNSLEQHRAYTVLGLIGVSGVGYALYGLSFFISENADTLFSGKAIGIQHLHEPFFNRNHTATYFGSCAILWFGMCLSESEVLLANAKIAFIDAVRQVVEDAPWRTAAKLAAFLICITATFLTLSRAGTLFTLGALLTCAGIFSYRTLRGHPRILLITAAAVLTGAILVETWGGTLAYRIGMEGLQDVGRFETYRATLSLIRDHLWLGTGLGTYEIAFPSYRTANTTTMVVWDHAHNTLLEMAAELGVVVAGATVMLVCFIAAMLFRGAVRRRRNAVLPLIAFCVGQLAVTHSLFDFSLQIPAYTILCAATIACGLAQSISSRDALASGQTE
jgi:O-antigen ligase